MSLTGDLFGPPEGLHVFSGFALGREAALRAAISSVTAVAPLRHMVTPWGKTMSAAMSNCGALGWVSDRTGYRYGATDPSRDRPWPDMPDIFATLAREAAEAAGFKNFAPDCGLINRYEAGAKMSLHQDLDEHDFRAPIVSVSLGLPAVFLWGGVARTGKPARVPVVSGDVLVWGGLARKNFHGIMPVKPGTHALFGPARYNLTFRMAG